MTGLSVLLMALASTVTWPSIGAVTTVLTLPRVCSSVFAAPTASLLANWRAWLAWATSLFAALTASFNCWISAFSVSFSSASFAVFNFCLAAATLFKASLYFWVAKLTFSCACWTWRLFRLTAFACSVSVAWMSELLYVNNGLSFLTSLPFSTFISAIFPKEGSKKISRVSRKLTWPSNFNEAISVMVYVVYSGSTSFEEKTVFAPINPTTTTAAPIPNHTFLFRFFWPDFFIYLFLLDFCWRVCHFI